MFSRSVILFLIVLFFSKSAFAKFVLGNIESSESLSLFPLSSQFKPGLDYKVHKKILERVEKAYGPIFAEKGLELVLRELWDENKVKARSFVWKEVSEFVVVIYGGLSRHPMMTEDAYVLILCHELGHYLGGAPFNVKMGQVAVSEGQADYFATAKCARKIFANENNNAVVSRLAVPTIVKKRCKESFPEGEDYAICLRSSLAAKTLADMARRWIKENRPDAPQFPDPAHHTPDKSTVSSTFHKHMAPQCRLDTSFAGATCRVSHEINFSSSDPEIGACHRRSGENKSARPRCWYKPTY